ncbi:MAG: Fe-S cluster domain-containing protein [Bacteroidales bacterium]|jgi:RnfABCDGE-type electron transport complex B subunit|nr:Fe-S cluster domain-containing protein [Bacteroidales bacterium]
MNVVLITIAVLVVLGLVASVILYFVANKFKVYEDPKIGEVESVLPGANCGGCGFPGCHGLAEALTKADDLSAIGCPVGGAPVMEKVAKILGKEVVASDPKVAVVRCNGSCDNRAHKLEYDGAKSCAIASTHFAGETDCSFGCFGYGDCVEACQFGAISIDEKTGLPVVDEEKCVACGACAKACPKNIIEIRKKGRVVQGTARRVWISCVNKDKGAVAMKACKTSCIGCGKCAKVCKFEAITIENNLAYIDPEKCKACGMCVNECPKKAIHATFTPPAPKPKPAPAPAATEAAKPEEKPAEQTNTSKE